MYLDSDGMGGTAMTYAKRVDATQAAPEPRYVLGCDPGYSRRNVTAFALIDPVTYQVHGLATIPGTGQPITTVQACCASAAVKRLFAATRLFAYERAIRQQNGTTIRDLEQTGAFLAGVLVAYGCPVVAVEPDDAKAALIRNGSATKTAMVTAAERLTGHMLIGTKTQRAAYADAIGIALAGYQQQQWIQREG